MTPRLIKAVRQRLAGRRKIFLFLDFDGTLAPIVPWPERARPGERLLGLLDDLADRPRVRVAVMSGRPLSWLRKKFENRKLILGGNHGMEISGPGFVFRHEGAAALKPVLSRVAKEARRVFREVPGVLVENKGLTVTVHYRRVPAKHLQRLTAAWRNLRGQTAAWPIRWRSGKKAWEALPRVVWDKGRAAALLLNKARDFPIAVGDDVTDEDMFRVFRKKGLTVRVGQWDGSLAEFYLKRREGVERLLVLIGDSAK